MNKVSEPTHKMFENQIVEAAMFSFYNLDSLKTYDWVLSDKEGENMFKNFEDNFFLMSVYSPFVMNI
jgi:hypothetical protein